MPEHGSGIRTQPWIAVGTPAKPGGQEQCSALFLASHLELGPQVLPTEQGSLQRPEMKYTLVNPSIII